jgi:hypothetical protein
MRLNSTGKNPCGPLAGIRDRDRRPCEGSSKASVTQLVVSARAASQSHHEWPRGADVRSAHSMYFPDTFRAKSWRQLALLANGCAMISFSVNKRVEFVFVPRAAGRSTQMKGIDRSNLSYRTILILFVLLGAPMAARAATLEDFARDMARKVGATLPPQEDVSVDIHNLSTLTPKEVDRVSQAFSGGLRDSGFNLDHGGATHVKCHAFRKRKGISVECGNLSTRYFTSRSYSGAAQFRRSTRFKFNAHTVTRRKILGRTGKNSRRHRIDQLERCRHSPVARAGRPDNSQERC